MNWATPCPPPTAMMAVPVHPVTPCGRAARTRHSTPFCGVGQPQPPVPCAATGPGPCQGPGYVFQGNDPRPRQPSKQRPPSRVELYLTGEIGVDGLARLEERCDLTNCTKLGSGSLGDVLLTHDRVLGQKVAVKAVSMEKLHRSGHSEASLKREITAMLAVKHPNIVSLYDVHYCTRPLEGASAPPPFACLVMEHVAKSQPLSVLIRSRGSDPQLARQVFPQLVAAMQEMHSRGHVHRDLWSENVLVDGEGKVVIIDLGCAAQFTSGPDVENRMNVPYMSPQASANERQQPGDDCWTMGCLLTEVVSGRFIADELGRCDTPLHHSPPTMAHVIRETYRLGCNELGDLATGLLERRAEARLTMRGVLRHMQAVGLLDRRADAQVAMRNATSRMQQAARAQSETKRRLMQKGGSVNGQRGDEVGGVLPGSEGAYPSRRRASLKRAGQPNHCSTKSGGSSASTAASAKDVHPQEMRPGCPPHLAAQVGSAPHTLPNGAPPMLPPQSQASGSLDVSGIMGDRHQPSVGIVASNTSAPRLVPGCRVNYLARSHNAEYKAIVVGREPGRNAWRLRVECGGDKIVEEGELWRIRRPPR
eukprot:TRINITY_DN43285_c0_g1_i1.p1 TRINITY_DN43285_c0_g1~~TRINITY_DN43285_c0_g1_i1.p1  ORF type:complete len:591 (+),score=89.66 TRINITY_DN43285_c0_g1_i1:118-1890(+)